ASIIDGCLFYLPSIPLRGKRLIRLFPETDTEGIDFTFQSPCEENTYLDLTYSASSHTVSLGFNPLAGKTPA
ncbi:MAG: hypothetical protein AAFR81_30505, partial [Chloroflexota bacterium]